MFASFESTANGLKTAVPERRLIRSSEGCLPCRQKRKKCDNVRPACGLCRNSTRRDVCTWPAEDVRRKRIRVSKSPSANGSTGRGDDASTSCSDTTEIECLSDRSLLSHLAAVSQELRSVGDLPPFDLPDSVKQVSPELSFPGILHITLAFQHRVLARKHDYSSSLMMLGLPTLRSNPALIHAWLASSIAAIYPDAEHRQRQALLHHGRALKALRIAMVSPGRVYNEEWIRGTILMLHIFEAIGSVHNHVKLSTAHLNAGHIVFGQSLKQGLPNNIHDMLLLEAYTFRVTCNCLFQQDNLPFDYMETLTSALMRTVESLGLEVKDPACLPWVGQIGIDLVIKIYKLSWLARRLPLTGQDAIEAAAIARSLPTHRPFAACLHGVVTDDDHDSRYWFNARTKQSFWHACSFLAELILSPDNTIASVTTANEHYDKGIRILDKASGEDRVTACLLWPLAVLGMAVDSPERLDRCQKIGIRLAVSGGRQASARMSVSLAKLYELRMERKGKLGLEEVLRTLSCGGVFL